MEHAAIALAVATTLATIVAAGETNNFYLTDLQDPYLTSGTVTYYSGKLAPSGAHCRYGLPIRLWDHPEALAYTDNPQRLCCDACRTSIDYHHPGVILTCSLTRLVSRGCNIAWQNPEYWYWNAADMPRRRKRAILTRVL